MYVCKKVSGRLLLWQTHCFSGIAMIYVDIVSTYGLFCAFDYCSETLI